MVMKKILIFVFAGILASCVPSKQQEKESNSFNGEMTAIIEDGLRKQLDEVVGESGMVVVVENQTGEVKACVDLVRKDSATFEVGDMLHQPVYSSLISIPEYLSLLELDALDDSTLFDTQNGIIELSDSVIKDHTWRVGGYGEISMHDVIRLSSNVGLALAINRFGDVAALNKKAEVLHCPINLNPMNPLTWVGQGVEYSPETLLEFYRIIANNGVISSENGKTNSIPASMQHIKTVKAAMRDRVENGVCRKVNSETVQIAAVSSVVPDENGLYHLQLCGYFPYDNPTYTMMVCIDKMDSPASASIMCGPLFMEIAERLK